MGVFTPGYLNAYDIRDDQLFYDRHLSVVPLLRPSPLEESKQDLMSERSFSTKEIALLLAVENGR